MALKLAVIDGAIGPRLDLAVALRLAFRLDGDGQVRRMAAQAGDALGHGSAVASLVLSRAPSCRLLSGQVFDRSGPASASAVADAIAWAVEEGARVVNLSLGLREDRRALRDSCADAIASGVVLIASCPARGGMSYPAGYDGVLAVLGDARCAGDDCSYLAPGGVFGAAPMPPVGFPGGGASYAAARIAGLAAAFFVTHPTATAEDLQHQLQASARFHGRERRQAAA